MLRPLLSSENEIIFSLDSNIIALLINLSMLRSFVYCITTYKNILEEEVQMKICIYGAGAIGGYLGAELARVKEADVSLIARGPHLDAIKKNGVK